MPIFLEPGEEFYVVLESDKSKPKETQPAFCCKAQSGRSQRSLWTFLDTNPDGETNDQFFDRNFAKLAELLTGWRNMGGHVYSREALEDVLTIQECRELIRKIANAQYVDADTKKG